MDVKYDPILDKLRERDTGGGSGGGDYIAGTGINSVALEGGTIAVANIPQSAVTDLTDSLAGKQPTISSGTTLDINITGNAATATSADSAGYATSAGTANALSAGVVVASATNATTAVTAGTATVYGGTVGYAVNAGTASTAAGVTQSVKDDIISSAGGILEGEIASVEEAMTGITGGTTAVVDVSALRGSLTAGQAVDVTSQPDDVTSDWKGVFNWTEGYLGFDNSFPKYAAGLSYLMIADLTYSSALGGEYILVSPSGKWLDGSTTAIRINDGETKRVAMIFASRTGRLTVDSFDPGDYIEVTNLREYEVTACSAAAIDYISALSNPDAFADYYLVKADMVQPWTYIIDMGTSPAVTIASGLSYKLNAMSGVHQLTVDTCPAGYDGRDAIIRITLGGNGVIQAVSPLQLGGALVPYAVNNCVVRFRDGEAVLLVEDTLAGYVVMVNTGTGEGSLPYGLAAVGVPYIAFSPSTDGVPVALSGATTAAEDVTVVGNGPSQTTISGSLTCTSNTTFANLTFSGSIVANGATLLADGIYHIDTVTGPAGLTIGSGVIVDLTGNTNATPIAPSGGIMIESAARIVYGEEGATTTGYIDGGTFSKIASGGVLSGMSKSVEVKSGVWSAANVTFARAETGADLITLSGGNLFMTSVGASEIGTGRLLGIFGGTATLAGCSTGPGAAITFQASGGTAVLTGSNHIGRGISHATNVSGTLVIADNATINESGAFLAIDPGGTNMITFGANVTVINNAGTSSLLNGGASGTCSKINTNGTIA